MKKDDSSYSIVTIIVHLWLLANITINGQRWHSFRWDSKLKRPWSYKDQPRGSSYWDEWTACKLGRLQSPVNISTDYLVFDKTLNSLQINGTNVKLSMTVENTGQDIYLALDRGIVVTFSGGPLSYKYQLFGAIIKFGSDSHKGSDHQIDNKSFPGELQLYAFNLDLYSNYTIAMEKPHGIAAVAVLFVLSESQKNTDMSGIVVAAEKTKFKGDTWPLSGIELQSLLPSIHQYMTYEGSIPFPGCHETVTWIILNQPIRMPETELKMLRSIESNNKESLANNFRSVQPLNNRSVRTNIQFQYKDPKCVNPLASQFSTNFPNL